MLPLPLQFNVENRKRICSNKLCERDSGNQRLVPSPLNDGRSTRIQQWEHGDRVMKTIFGANTNRRLPSSRAEALPVSRYPYLLLPAWLLLVSLPSLYAAEPAFDDGLRKQLGELTARGLPGIAVLVARDGKIAFQGGFGLANVETKEPVTPETKFRIGSVSKQFTAAAILRLAEEGKLTIDDPLEKFFPGFPSGKEVTLYHLLTHTSGIHSYTSKWGFRSRIGKPILPGELIAWFRDDPPDFAPGAGWSYCNSGYFLLGEVVEKVSGKSYATYLSETFFDPLEMRDTGIYKNAAPPGQMAIGYAATKGKVARALDWDMSWAGGAGAIYSTVGDLFRWNEALFGGRVLKPESFKTMMTPVKLPEDVDGLTYGCGLGMLECKRLPVVAHDGGLDGWSSSLIRMPEQNCTIVALGNALPPVPGFSPSLIAWQTAQKFLADDIKKLPPLQENTAVDKSSWPDFVGRYGYKKAVLTVTMEGTHLYAQLTGQLRYEIFPKATNEFFWKVADARVVFLRNAKGEVVAARHTQKGSTFRAPRIRPFHLIDGYRGQWLITITGNFALVMSVFCAPMWFFGRKRVQWTWLDFSVAWIPLAVWLALSWLGCIPKSTDNRVEAVFVGALTALCPMIRLIGKHWIAEKTMARITAALGAALAAAVYFATPYL